MLTDEQKKAYLADGAINCPYCGSQNVDQDGEPEMDIERILQAASCRDCGKRWADVYKLADVEERHPPKGGAKHEVHT